MPAQQLLPLRAFGAPPNLAQLSLRPAGASQMQLLDFLMARGRLDAVHRDRVLALRRERGESESVIITRLGMVDERDMAQCLAEFLEIPLARAGDYPAAPCGPAGLTAEFVARA